MTDEREYMDKRWVALALLCMAQFVVVLDASIVNVALPTIGKDLQFDQDSLSWVVNAYVLTFGGFLLLGGRLADLLGRRKIFIVGLLVFAAASLAGGFAESEGALIAARAIQGLGGALLSPAALSIVTTTFKDGSERNKALGIWGAVAGSGGAAGVLLGGVLTEYVGWEWVLWVNVPIGIGAAMLAPRLILESHSDAENRTFDIPGAVTVTAGLVAPRLRAGRGARGRLGLARDAWHDRRRPGAAGGVRRDRASLARAAGSVQHLPLEDADGGERGRPFDWRVALQHVLLHLALHAERVGLQRHQGGTLVSALGRLDHPRGRDRVSARDEDRLQARDGDGHGVRRRRPCLVQPDLGRWQLPGRRPLPVAPRRNRTRVLVRAGHDRRHEQRQGPRGRPRLGPDQHLAAGRRRPGPRDPLVRCVLLDRGRDRSGHARPRATRTRSWSEPGSRFWASSRRSR